MKRLLVLVFALFSCVLIEGIKPSEAAFNDICDDADNDGRIDDTATSSTYYCFVDMDGAKAIFHEIYICDTAPTLTGFRDNCQELFTNETGVEVTFEPGKKTNLPLNSTLSIAPGTYTHFVITTGNIIRDKMMVQFETNKRGRTSSGTWCWTTENQYVKTNRDVTLSAIECGATPPSEASWSYQYSNYMCASGPAPKALENTKTSTHSATNKTTTSHVVDVDGNLFTYSGSTCPTNASSFSDTGPRKTLFQPLRNSAVISASTSVIEISMGLEGYGRVQLRRDGASSCTGYSMDCVVALRSKAPEFIVTAR